MIEQAILREKITENIRKLMSDYESEIIEAYDRLDDDDKLDIAFKSNFGETKKGFEIRTTMSFVGTRTKDSITCIVDPKQPELPLGDQGDQDAA